MRELKQRKNFSKREFRISDSKLFYNYSKFGNGDEIDIPFENLSGEKVSYKWANNALLTISTIIYIIAIALFVSNMRGEGNENFAWLFWTGVATFCLVIYWFTREDFWKIKLIDNSYLYIHKNIPSKEAADQFLIELLKSRNDFLRENYAVIDENLSYESQLNNFRWLKSINAITSAEFDEKYTELKKTVKPDKPNIGFGK